METKNNQPLQDLEGNELINLHPDDQLIIEKAREHSKKYAKSLVDLVQTNLPHRAQETPKPYTPPPKEQVSRSFQFFLNVLHVFPFVLGFTFVASFFWDFPNSHINFFEYKLTFDGILRIISVSGLIGFLTNWLAITMLFKPVQRRPILGQGLVPAHKERIAGRLAQSVSTELINPELIRKKLEENNLIGKYREKFIGYTKQVIDSPDLRDGLKILVRDYVNEMIGDEQMREVLARRIFQQLEKAVEDKQFENMALKAYKFLRGEEAQQMIEKAIAEIPSRLEMSLDGLDHWLDRIPQTIDEHSDNLEKWASQAIYNLVAQLDVFSIVEENLNKYDEQKFEKLIRSATNEQLRYIQYLGAILGTIGGLVIWEPVISLTVLSTIGLLIYGVDRLLGGPFPSYK